MSVTSTLLGVPLDEIDAVIVGGLMLRVQRGTLKAAPCKRLTFQDTAGSTAVIREDAVVGVVRGA